MRCTIRFIGCHPVSPQEGKGGAGKLENQGGKHGKSAGTKGRKRKMYEWQSESKEKRQKTTWAARNRQKKNCNMQSWERAKPLSPFKVSSDGIGRRFGLENSGWRAPLGYYNETKYLPSIFFH